MSDRTNLDTGQRGLQERGGGGGGPDGFRLTQQGSLVEGFHLETVYDSVNNVKESNSSSILGIKS